MTTISYRPLATISAKVKGKGVPVSAVRFSPTPSTLERLAGQRILFRSFPGGFRLAAQHDLERGGGPLVPIAGDLTLLFAVKLGEKFAAGDEKAGPSIYLTNRNASGTPQGGPQLSREEAVGTKDRAWIVPRRYFATIALGSGTRPKNLELRSAFGGGALETFPIDVAADASAVSLPVTVEQREGVAFLLKPKPSGNDRLIVADDELAEMGPDAALELVLRSFPGPAPATGREFTATFEPR
jgi:hypothetical protein